MGKINQVLELKKGSNNVSNMGLVIYDCSGVQTSSALIYTGPCLFGGIKMLTDGVNDVTTVLYDNIEAAGDEWDRWKVKGEDEYGGGYPNGPIKMNSGLYVTLSGTGGKFVVFYAPV